MILETIPRPQDSRWPAEAVLAGAGYKQALAAPGNDMSFYVTGYAGYAASAQTMTLLRRTSKILTGADAEITISDNALLEPADGDFGWSFWIKTKDVSALVIQKGDPASADGYEIAVTSAGKIKVTLQDAAAATATKTGDTAINDGLWHHVCIRADRDPGTLWIYVDGEADHAAALDISSVTGNITGGATNLTMAATAGKTCYLSTFAFYKAGMPTVATEWNNGLGRRLVSTDTYLSVGYQLNEGLGTAGYDVKGALNITYTTDALTAWVVGGPPLDDRDENSALDTIQAVCKLGATTTFVSFPHAIKIGRAAPLAVALSGAATVRLFGFCDTY